MRSLPEQREMLQEAIRETRTSADPRCFEREKRSQAALRNQEVQALTLIAMELGALNGGDKK